MATKKSKIEVKVYSTSSCPWCVKVKSFLKKHKIKFKNIDVSKNHKAKQEMIKKSHQTGVPVVEVGRKIVIGFDEEEMREALNL